MLCSDDWIQCYIASKGRKWPLTRTMSTFIYHSFILLRKVHILERTPITVVRGQLDIWMGQGWNTQVLYCSSHGDKVSPCVLDVLIILAKSVFMWPNSDRQTDRQTVWRGCEISATGLGTLWTLGTTSRKILASDVSQVYWRVWKQQQLTV